MANLEIGGQHHKSSITKNARKNAGFNAGVLGMRLVYESVNFDDPSPYPLAYAEEPAPVELVAVRRLGRRVAEKAGLLVGGRAHV